MKNIRCNLTWIRGAGSGGGRDRETILPRDAMFAGNDRASGTPAWDGRNEAHLETQARDRAQAMTAAITATARLSFREAIE